MSADGLTPEELQAETAIALPDKEVVSILDLNVDVDVVLDAASPIDLAVAAQLNGAAAIDAAAGASVGANVITWNSDTTAFSSPTAIIDQKLTGLADAYSNQDSTIDQATTQS